jgi:hypothetical protein
MVDLGDDQIRGEAHDLGERSLCQVKHQIALGVGKSRKPFLGFHGHDVPKDPSSRGAWSSLNPVGACDRVARRLSIPERHAADSRADSRGKT